MSGETTSKLRKMMAMGATPEHGLIVVRWHYISTIKEWRNDVDLCADAADEIERLRAERDEARRWICDLSFEDKKEVANKLGWDCFKEDK